MARIDGQLGRFGRGSADLGVERLPERAEQAAHREFPELGIRVAVEPARESSCPSQISVKRKNAEKEGDPPLVDDGRLEFAEDVGVVEFGGELDPVRAAAVGGVEDAVRFRVGLDS